MLLKVGLRNLLQLAIIGALVSLASCTKPAPSEHWHGETMGTTYSVVVRQRTAPLSEAKHRAIQQALDSELLALNKVFSTYDPTSELSRFNQADTNAWYAVSSTMVTVIKRAIALNKATDGAFDITVGRLVNAYGFGVEERIDMAKLDARELARIMPDIDALEMRKAPPALRKTRDIEVDVSAIAKGYAVDVLSDYLIGQGFRHHLVEIGGELRARGYRDADATPWRIGIETPASDAFYKAFDTVALSDGEGMATSGDYRNFRMEDGKRIGHIVDPRTGKPSEHRLASVSVWADNTADADAFATALWVMGEVQGVAFARRQGMKAFFIYAADGTSDTHADADAPRWQSIKIGF